MSRRATIFSCYQPYIARSCVQITDNLLSFHFITQLLGYFPYFAPHAFFMSLCIFSYPFLSKFFLYLSYFISHISPKFLLLSAFYAKYDILYHSFQIFGKKVTCFMLLTNLFSCLQIRFRCTSFFPANSYLPHPSFFIKILVFSRLLYQYIFQLIAIIPASYHVSLTIIVWCFMSYFPVNSIFRRSNTFSCEMSYSLPLIYVF